MSLRVTAEVNWTTEAQMALATLVRILLVNLNGIIWTNWVLGGGLLYGNSFGNNLQYHEWTSFISDGEFCIRACVGAHATALCNHVYDIMGCYWNIPASYSRNVYEDCQGDAA